MPVNSITCAIVGWKHRPPARQILDVLPLGTPLEIRPEPTNPYDPNAIMVLVDMQNFPVAKIQLLQDLLPVPYDACELCAEGIFHLGYIPDSNGKYTSGLPANAEAADMIQEHGLDNLVATLASSLMGFATVKISPKE